MLSSKPLWINGSPKKDGFTMRIANYVLADFEITPVHAYDQNVHACDDCKVCHYKLGCKFKDDHTTIIESLKNTDTLILTTPIYFGAMSDQLLKIINRFQQLFERVYSHDVHDITLKNLIIISTCASTDPKMYDGLRLTTHILEKLFNVENTHTLLLHNTDNEDPMHAELKTIKTFKETIKKALN